MTTTPNLALLSHPWEVSNGKNPDATGGSVQLQMRPMQMTATGVDMTALCLCYLSLCFVSRHCHALPSCIQCTLNGNNNRTITSTGHSVKKMYTDGAVGYVGVPEKSHSQDTRFMRPKTVTKQKAVHCHMPTICLFC